MFRSFSNWENLEKGLNLLTREMSDTYVLSFRPSVLAPGPHALRLIMKDRADLSDRTGYWLDSENADSPEDRKP